MKTALGDDLVMTILLAIAVLVLSVACSPDQARVPVQPPPLPDAGKGWGTPAYVKMCRDPARYDAELCGDLR